MSQADMLSNLHKMIASLEQTKNKSKEVLDHEDANLKYDIQVEEALSYIPPNTVVPIYRGRSKLHDIFRWICSFVTICFVECTSLILHPFHFPRGGRSKSL
mmetsp:Transcript_14056/g.22937  ORF Transcript_14056/g.22937 Transcript_14056/m.22937 type:complete len:101 (-) Transcript_14056:103-405(-)